MCGERGNSGQWRHAFLLPLYIKQELTSAHHTRFSCRLTCWCFLLRICENETKRASRFARLPSNSHLRSLITTRPFLPIVGPCCCRDRAWTWYDGTSQWYRCAIIVKFTQQIIGSSNLPLFGQISYQKMTNSNLYKHVDLCHKMLYDQVYLIHISIYVKWDKNLTELQLLTWAIWDTTWEDGFNPLGTMKALAKLKQLASRNANPLIMSVSKKS